MGKKNRRNAAKPKAESAPKAVIDVTSPYTCTGALRKQATWNDIILDSFSLSFFGRELIQDSTLQLSGGRKYGLVGANGSGKSKSLDSFFFIFFFT